MPQRLPTSETKVSPPWKVSELARRTGVTIRTLHHYDAIGLLTPSNRTPGAHRLYSSEDVSRLHQIHSLRTLGFPLAEIRAMELDYGKLARRTEELSDGFLKEWVSAASR